LGFFVSEKEAAMKKSLSFVLLCIFVLYLSNLGFAGPFGLEGGMTKQEIIAIVGKDSLIEAKTMPENWYILLNKLPRPHPLFKTCRMAIDPDLGLVKLVVRSSVIKTNLYGDEIKSKFKEIREALISKYGKCKTYDLLRTGSIWGEPQEWMRGLKEKERILVAIWIKGEHGLEKETLLKNINLSAVAVTVIKGVLFLSYEFEGFDQFLEKQKKKEVLRHQSERTAQRGKVQ
jgi:hypothetical protein